MSLIELAILAVALSMDAFAVAVCKGLSMSRFSLKKALTVGLYFGIFQAAMPMLGYLLGSLFAEQIRDFDHWIAFALLFIIGIKMVKEGREPKDKKSDDSSLAFGQMLVLSVATSIDALAVGITFAFLRVNVLFAVSLIGLSTLLLSALGVKIGSIFGARYKSRAEVSGGAILIALGLKILLEHLGIIG
ncbi:MAG: manganese efflux pump MntP family protein [Clostridia bacterium]|nr:manganese efflux pump MntP family protein [Clostridia bacterium]